MNNLLKHLSTFKRMGLASALSVLTYSSGVSAASMALSDEPLFLAESVAPLTMLVMGRDHKLYYEAYNDASDLNGDGKVDVGYEGYHGTAVDSNGKYKNVDYYGYFNSYACYDYNGTTGRFEPKSAKTAAEIAAKNKTCAGGTSGEWSGDFLNYVTTARIDAVRKVLYGGLRSTDTTTQTVLERTHIPQDAHSWGKEYHSVARDGYNIADYTNLSQPVDGTYHLLANVSLNSTAHGSYGSMNASATPRLRVLANTKHRIWEWLSKERPVAGAQCINGIGGATVNCEATASATVWEKVPASAFVGLTRKVYNTTGYTSYPSGRTQFNTLETNYGTSSNLLGTNNPTSIDGTGNPFTAQQDDYMTIFEGKIKVPYNDSWVFSVDGDSAIDVAIDHDDNGTLDAITGWYGNHTANASTATRDTYASTAVSMVTTKEYNLKFRHQERTGADSYYLYWKRTYPASTMTDYIVRVQVCTSIDSTISHQTNSCTAYPSGNYKPTGLLNEFGENDSMMFGLLSGSYENNLDGGVLRKAVSSFTDEVDLTTGVHNTSTSGIINTLNKFRVTSFNDSTYAYGCGWITTQPISGNQCEMWGNPVAEMLYETLRYFSGKTAPTSDFDYGSATTTRDAVLGLPRVGTWSDPYHPTTGYDECAAPFQLVMSDINPSYDTDKIPGAHSSFSSTFTGDISGLNASTLADTITTGEGNIAGNSFFIGQSDSIVDNAPTAKTISSLASARGISPEEPTKLGGYYAASMAYYGYNNDLHATAAGDQNLQTFAVALASPLPTISIDPDNNPATNNSVTVVPFAKSVGGSSISSTGSFQPTNQIVDFYVESLNATSGSFLVNFEDVEQGADHDMDAIARYTYSVNTSTGAVTITVDSLYAAGGIDQHMGYVISGTTKDGVYLEVKDQGGANIVYKLDTPSGVWAGDTRGTTMLGLTNTRTFTPSMTGTSASFLKDPLWYAAKWGGFADGNSSNTPDVTAEWDDDLDGNPDNYFLVTNALTLKDQMKAAFDEILARSGSSSTVTVSTGSLNTDSLLYQAVFDTDGWIGRVRAIDFSSGTVGQENWEFATKLSAQLNLSGGHDTQREIITMNDAGTGVPFRFPADYNNPEDDEISTVQASLLLNGITSDHQSYGTDLVDYLRGADDEESGNSGSTRLFRNREVGGIHHVLGDIIHSDPLYVIPPGFFYPDSWPTTLDSTSVTPPENTAGAQSYSAFRSLLKDREPVLYIGSNDGMLHAINAYKNVADSNPNDQVVTPVTDGGEEILAYVPKALYHKLPALADSDYDHDYYVDGKTTYADAFFSDKMWHTVLVGTLHGGGQALYALDITDPKNIVTTAYPSFDEADADDLALWEFSDANDADLGFTYGRPTIVRLANGQWGAIFGNGYDNTHPDGNISTTGNAVLYIVNVETGALIKKFDTLVGTSADPTASAMPNGMSEAAPVDIDGDFVADYVYAGDLFGNLWKIDISNPNTTNWDFAFKSGANPAPLFVAQTGGSTPKRLPITQRPMVGSHPVLGHNGDVMVYFGTGKYLESPDNLSTGQDTQSVFGIWDDGTNGKARSGLLTQTLEEVTDARFTGDTFRIVSDNAIAWEDVYNQSNTLTQAKHGGWVMDLIDYTVSTPNNHGERSVSNAILRDGRLTITTLIPSADPCDYGGSGWVMTVDAVDGSRLDFTAIDANDDGDFSTDDLIDTDGDGEGDTYASSVLNTDGIPTTPAQVDSDDSTINVVGRTDGSIEVFKSPLDGLVNKRLFWRELK